MPSKTEPELEVRHDWWCRLVLTPGFVRDGILPNACDCHQLGETAENDPGVCPHGMDSDHWWDQCPIKGTWSDGNAQ